MLGTIILVPNFKFVIINTMIKRQAKLNTTIWELILKGWFQHILKISFFCKTLGNVSAKKAANQPPQKDLAQTLRALPLPFPFPLVSFIYLLFFCVVLGFELRASGLLSRRSIT
jgi:hypothetical protein